MLTSKEELIELYKAKPELIQEHKRLVDILRHGSKKKQMEEAARQLNELKGMMEKKDRCWEGYAPVPGKKPYEKGSCAPIKKEEVLKVEANGQWSLDKSNYGPKSMALYNPVDNIKRKESRTGEELEHVGQNKAVRQYTSAKEGTADQQADRQAKADKKRSSKNPVRTMKDMAPEELEAIKARYAAKAEGMAKSQLSDAEAVSLMAQVARRQPTDREIEMLFEYNHSRVQAANQPLNQQENQEEFGY